jgi:hypothetical protein
MDGKLPKNLLKVAERWLEKLELGKYELKITVCEPDYEIELDESLGMVHWLDGNGKLLDNDKNFDFKTFRTIWIEMTLSNFKTKKIAGLEQTLLHELLHVKYPEHRFDNAWTERKVKGILGSNYIKPIKR